MSLRVWLLVGTQRGFFLLESDADRSAWQVHGPLGHAGWSYGYARFDERTGVIYAAGHNAWFGPAVWRSPDLGKSWSLSSEGLTFGDQAPGIRQVWNITPGHGRLYAGVDPAGLFQSEDGGQNWTEAGARLLDQPAAGEWLPGKGGLPVHSILPHPTDPQQIWVATAGGGILHTADGGATWSPRNATDAAGRPLYRVQKLAAAPGQPKLLYQQNHQGVFRSDDGGLTWTDITANLPSRFGFCLAVGPHDPQTLYTIPMRNEQGMRTMAEGRLAVWRSRDGGQSWTRLQRGLPDGVVFTNVLRHGLATDRLRQAGVYFGTSSGHVYGSTDGGETWFTLAANLPEIRSIATAVTE